jgi:hypothetical protein
MCQMVAYARLCAQPMHTRISWTHDAMVGVPGASRLMIEMSPSALPAARRWFTDELGLNWTERTAAAWRSMWASWAFSPSPANEFGEGKWGGGGWTVSECLVCGGRGCAVGLTLKERACVPHGHNTVSHAADDETVASRGVAGVAAGDLAPGER